MITKNLRLKICNILMTFIIFPVFVALFFICSKAVPLLAPYSFLFLCSMFIAARVILMRIINHEDESEERWLFQMTIVLLLCGFYLFFVYAKALLNAPGHFVPF